MNTVLYLGGAPPGTQQEYPTGQDRGTPPPPRQVYPPPSDRGALWTCYVVVGMPLAVTLDFLVI